MISHGYRVGSSSRTLVANKEAREASTAEDGAVKVFAGFALCILPISFLSSCLLFPGSRLSVDRDDYESQKNLRFLGRRREVHVP